MVSTKLRIKELLRQRRWTTKVLAGKTGVSESYLTHIKNGTRRWNEDALKKLADAFDLEPADVFAERLTQPNQEIRTITSSEEGQTTKAVPVVGKIPAYPSLSNNYALQVSTGYQNVFVPAIEDVDDVAMFCLCIDDMSMAPAFGRGDYLVISPETWTRSGDLAAIEYGNETPIRAIKQVAYTDDFIILGSVNRVQPPIALVRGKDHFRVIGKVVYHCQNF